MVQQIFGIARRNCLARYVSASVFARQKRKSLSGHFCNGSVRRSSSPKERSSTLTAKNYAEHIQRRAKKDCDWSRAWAAEQSVVLGQVRTAEKSNEITVIPELLAVLELSGAIVTIDAMGCQKAIAGQIRDQEADYVLALKGNQGNLHRAVADYFDWAERQNWHALTVSTGHSLEKGHGRIEQRRVLVTQDIDWIVEKQQWRGLRSIVMVESEREIIGGGKSTERRFFISSLEANANQIAAAVRGHWAIENQLHWSPVFAFTKMRVGLVRGRRRRTWRSCDILG